MSRSLDLALRFAPPGHFYSPHPDLDEVERKAERIYRTRPMPGVDLRTEAQLALLARLAGWQDLPWTDDPQAGLRFHYENGFFGHGDAVVLQAMLREFRPRRVLEVGSGHSTALMLDVADRFLDGALEIECIEPFADRLRSRLRPEDAQRLKLHESGVQEVDLAVFDRLQGGDILFIDSSHISKVGSDLNLLLFEVLPALRDGVIVHFHDIFDGFEYPLGWLLEGRAWNEAYLLRAFLQYNTRFEILFFNNHLHQRHGEAIRTALPLSARNPGGSLWLLKTGVSA